MTNAEDQLYVAGACRHDVPDLVALAQEALPPAPALHDHEGWRTSFRFDIRLRERDLTARRVTRGSRGTD